MQTNRCGAAFQETARIDQADQTEVKAVETRELSTDISKVISLASTPERLEAFRRNNPFLEAEVFSACNGRDLISTGQIDPKYFSPENTYSPPATGCALSHVKLWEEAAVRSGNMTIMEDDVLLHPDFAAIRDTTIRKFSARMNWDIIVWCWNLDWPMEFELAPGLPRSFLMGCEKYPSGDVNAFYREKISPRLHPLFTAAGTPCYTVSPKGARRLLERSLPIGKEPVFYPTGRAMYWEVSHPEQTIEWANDCIDIEMSRHYPALESFVAIPPPAFAPNDQAASTIRGLNA